MRAMLMLRTSTGVGMSLLLALVLGSAAGAEEITWNSYSGGEWCQAGNWYPEDVPDEAAEHAILGGTNDYTVYVGGNVYPGAVTVANPNATVRLGSVGVGVGELGYTNHGTILVPVLAGISGPIINEIDGRIQVAPEGIFRFGDGPVLNHGLIVVNTAGIATPARFELDNVAGSLGGSGSLLLQAGGDPENAVLGSYGGAILTHESGHTVHGTGLISAPLVNAGTVTADVAGSVLRLSNAMGNGGTLEAVNGAILEIGGMSVVQEQYGLIRADAATVRILNGTRVEGGTLSAAGGGVIESRPGTTAICEATLTGDLDVLGGSRLVAGYDTFTNDGTITLNPDELSEDAVLSSWQYHNVTLAGTGQVVLRTAGDVNDARLETTGERIINGPQHTIRGEGAITCHFENQGRVAADAEGEVLRISGGATTNSGVLEASQGGVLELSGTTLTQQTSGTVLADGGTVRILNGTRVTAGTLATTGSAAIETHPGTTAICEATLTGDLDVLGGSWLVAGYDTFTNDGTITLNPRAQSEDAVLSSWQYHNVTLAGTGQVVLRTAGDVNDARLETTGERIINGPQHTIRGEGSITCPFTNNGRLTADVAGRTLQATGPLANNGTVDAANGGTARLTSIGSNYYGGGLHGGTWNVHANSTLRLRGAAIYTLDAAMLLDGENSNVYSDDATTDALAALSAVTAGGRLELRNGRSLSVPGGLQNAGAVVVGPGSTLGVEDDLTNTGQLQPGRTYGRVAVGGDFTQSAGGTLVIELAGLTPDLFDRVTATGTARLGGTLVLRAVGGFTPPDNASFEIVTCGARLGEFDQVVCELPAGQSAQVVYGATSVAVVTSAASGVEEPATPEEPEGPSAPAVEGPSAPVAETRLSARATSGGEAILALELTEPATVRVSVYDIGGRRVATPVDAAASTGFHAWRWDGRGSDGRRLASGAYLVRAHVCGATGIRALRADLVLIR